MTEPAGASDMLLQPSVIEELLRTLLKALRAYQIYLPNNPIYHKAQAAVQAAFKPIWEVLDELVLVVAETDFTWEEIVVYHQPNKHESLAWTLFKDGMRILTLRKGCEDTEITRLLLVVQRARMLPSDADDDLNTLLWEQQFELITYRFTEFLSDTVPAEFAASLEPQGLGKPGTETHASVMDEVKTAKETGGGAAQSESEEGGEPGEGASDQGRTGIVDLEDFDSTLYFLDEREVRYLSEALEKEYAQDLRRGTMNALFDLLEIQSDAAIRDEILGVLEVLVPSLLNASEFRHVAFALRELRTVSERGRDFTETQRQRLDDFRSKLSDPGVLTQLLQVVDEAVTAPSPEDLGELFRELRSGALETILVWLPRLRNASVRDLLVSASERLADSSPAEVMRLLKLPESEALPAIIDLCGRLKLQGAVAGLGETLTHADRDLRLATVKALTTIGSAGALSQLERALDDPEREVRILAVRAMGARGYKNALKRIETAVLDRGGLRDADISERIAFFEAYALIAGPAALQPLTSILVPGGIFRRKEGPQTRACAALALGKLQLPQARAVLERASVAEKDLVVRNAVQRALREFGQ